MSKKNKKLSISMELKNIGRGEWGKDFYLSTFRFPIKEAQGFERRTKALGFTMASALSQLMMAFNKAVPAPADKIKLERTAKPTVWGDPSKAKKAKPAKAKKATKLKVVKAAKKAPKTKPAKAEKPEKLSNAEKLRQKLKALKKKNEAA